VRLKRKPSLRGRPAFEAFFDRSGRVQRPPYERLWGEARSLLLYHPTPPEARRRMGKDHVVLVLPGFLTADVVTLPLRRFLERCGFRVFGWGLGVNVGPTPRLLAGLRRRLDELTRLEGGPISIVGVSLGGLLARDVAYDRPDDVRLVVTIASPFRLPTASTIEPLVQLCTPLYSTAIDLQRLTMPLPVPSLALYTRTDGLVAWQSCSVDDENAAAIEVSGTHVTMCRNPEVMRVVAQRLATDL
jgi:pimeloyl-ACP methyl ester carboxylesterase